MAAHCISWCGRTTRIPIKVHPLFNLFFPSPTLPSIHPSIHLIFPQHASVPWALSLAFYPWTAGCSTISQSDVYQAPSSNICACHRTTNGTKAISNATRRRGSRRSYSQSAIILGTRCTDIWTEAIGFSGTELQIELDCVLRIMFLQATTRQRTQSTLTPRRINVQCEDAHIPQTPQTVRHNPLQEARTTEHPDGYGFSEEARAVLANHLATPRADNSVLDWAGWRQVNATKLCCSFLILTYIPHIEER